MSYTPTPINTDDVKLDKTLEDLVEALAEDVHNQWALERMKSGWKYGPERNDQLKHHPCLVPYNELPESEKQYDRITAITTLKLIKKFGFDIVKKK